MFTLRIQTLVLLFLGGGGGEIGAGEAVRGGGVSRSRCARGARRTYLVNWIVHLVFQDGLHDSRGGVGGWGGERMV